MIKLRALFLSLPKWVLTIMSLSPLVMWPMVFFASIFIFDDPNAKHSHQYMMFYAVNAYPIFLIANTIVAHRLHTSKRKTSVALFTWPFILFCLLIISVALWKFIAINLL